MLGFFAKFPGGRNRELFFLIREFQKGIRDFLDPQSAFKPFIVDADSTR
jgi:hypothetical protein